MNIFVLDLDPKIAAAYHCDKHIVKMNIEQNQMLSTAINLVIPDHNELTYKTTHINHPCSIWVRKSKQNFDWSIAFAEALSNEYTKRYGKIHKSSYIINIAKKYSYQFPDIGLTTFAQAMPDQFKSTDVVNAYRLYYSAVKMNICKWAKLNNTPDWWESYRNYVIINNLEAENTKNDGVVVNK